MGNDCSLAPRKRPISCYKDSVLEEDMDELKDLLENYDISDKLLALYLEDFWEKKLYKEGKVTIPAQLPIACGVAPQNLPYECYENQVLKRDTPELKDAYDKYHAKDLQKFNQILEELIKKKEDFYGK